MSIQGEIERIQKNVSDAFEAVSEMGGDVPASRKSDNLANAVKSIPVGPTYAAGDGISIDEDSISVTNPNRGIYTEGEFEKLSPDQKKTGTYIIDDGRDETLIGANIYSLDETIVGRWIDGKPIYRKVIISTTGNAGADKIIGNISNDCETIIRLDGIIVDRNGYHTKVPDLRTVLIVAKNELSLYITTANSGSAYANCPIAAIVEYTKSADPATITITSEPKAMGQVRHEVEVSKSEGGAE